jgi:CDP-diacylglycerol--glycerol-3-phosphate 3-phosphatidyltransferase
MSPGVTPKAKISQLPVDNLHYKHDSCNLKAIEMNLAHFFTLLRIGISPLFPLLYLEYEWLGIPFVAVPYCMLGLLFISESSDIFDGLLARRRNQVTDLGKILDPVADSATHISLFFTFTQGVVQLPILLVLVFLYRELFVGALRTLCALRGIALAARASGKLKAIFQAVVCCSICALMIPFAEGVLAESLFRKISLYLTAASALYTAVSTLDYLSYIKRLYI